MSLDILYFLAVNRTQNNIDLPKYVFHFEMWSRFLGLKASFSADARHFRRTEASRRLNPAKWLSSDRASESVASCQAPQPGYDSADWTAWAIGSGHFLRSRASFVPGGLCVSRRGIFRCVAALSPSSPLGKFETTKQELSALSVKGWLLARSERVGMQTGNLASSP